MHKKSGSTVSSRPKKQNIIIKQKFGNIMNYSTIPETLEECFDEFEGQLSDGLYESSFKLGRVRGY